MSIKKARSEQFRRAFLYAFAAFSRLLLVFIVFVTVIPVTTPVVVVTVVPITTAVVVVAVISADIPVVVVAVSAAATVISAATAAVTVSAAATIISASEIGRAHV